jgi:hypothetical protein
MSPSSISTTRGTPRAVRLGCALALAAAATALPWAPPARAEVPTDPPTFSDPLDIDNEHHPFVTFRIRLYEQTQGGEDAFVIDVFLPETRTFTLEDGTEVECATLQEWEVVDGEVHEISWNWFAQADDGTVHYFGEVVDVYEGGVVDHHGGSWLVGGPGPGDPEETLTADAPTVFMPGDPEKGDEWKAEDLPELGVEEFDRAMGFDDEIEVPYGELEDVLRVREKTPDLETKWYAPGIGFVRSKSGSEVVELVDVVDSGDEDEMEEALEAILDEILG